MIVPTMVPLHVTPSPNIRRPSLNSLPKSRGTPPPNVKAVTFARYAGSIKYITKADIFKTLIISGFIVYLWIIKIDIINQSIL
jgi:hypothetical protein